MKLIIDIPEAEYNKTLQGEFNVTLAHKAVKDGKPLDAVLDEIRAEFKRKRDGDDWYHTTDGLVWGEAIEILDKHRQAESEG